MLLTILACVTLLCAPLADIALHPTSRAKLSSECTSSHIRGVLNQRSSMLQWLRSARAWIRYYGFGVSPHPDFMVTDGGWFVRTRAKVREKNHRIIDVGSGLMTILNQGKLSTGDLQKIGDELTRRKALAESRGARYLVAIIPSKGTVYAQEMFSSLASARPIPTSRGKQVATYLQTHTDVEVVALEDILLREKNSKSPLYFKTDAHWNTLGAYYGYRAVIEQLTTSFPDLPRLSPLTMDELNLGYDTEWCHNNFRHTVGLCIKEPFPFFTVPDTSRLFSVPVLPPPRNIKGKGRRRTRQPTNDAWQNAATTSLLRSNGIGRTKYPAGKLTDKNGAQQHYKWIRNFGNVPLDSIVVVSASFGEKTLYFFAAHARNTLRFHSTNCFDTFSTKLPREILNQQGINKIDLYVQFFPEGVLSSVASCHRYDPEHTTP